LGNVQAIREREEIMPSTLTFTGPIGPGNSLTSKVFNNVIRADWRLKDKVLEVEQSSDNPQGNYITELDVRSITTVTHTISAGDHTITVS
jgi:hypothetical protein